MKFIIEGRKGLYSPFEDRIIFPIKDHLGKFCGFGGRVFSKDDKRPKYINSHEHEFFDKKTLLYGLDTAKKSIQTKNSVFLVEGYTDVIAMFQYGYENTVATLGTSCNERHFQQLSRYTDKAYMLYDGDIAGQNAIIKISEFCWKENIDPYVIILPNGYDPASFLQKYKSLDNLIDSAKNIYDFLIENHYKDFNSMSLSNKLSSTKKLISIVYNLQDNIKQDLLLNQISNKFGISFQILKEELSKLKPNNQVSPEPKKSLATHQIVKKINNNLNNNLQKNNPTKLRLLEKKLFLVILKNENDLDQDSKFILQKLFSHPLNKLYSEIIYIKQESNAKSISDIMSQIKNEEFKQVFSKIIIEAESYNSEESTKDLLAQFYKVKWKEIVNIMKIKINDALSKENNELAKNLLTKLDMLKKKLLKKGIS